MILKVNQENMQAMSRIGLKTLFDGYLTKAKFLYDGYVIDVATYLFKPLIISDFLCDGYVIGSPILFDGHLIKEKL